MTPRMRAVTAGLLLPLMLLGPMGCGVFTRGLWDDAASGRVAVDGVEGFLIPDPPDGRRGSYLVVRCEGDGLNGGPWWVLLPADDDLRLRVPAARPSLEGLGSDEIWRVLNREASAPTRGDLATLRERYAEVRPDRGWPGGFEGWRFEPAPRQEVRIARRYALLAYWPPSADATPVQYVVPVRPEDNLVEVVVGPAPEFDPVPRVAIIPRTFQRSPSGRTANVAAATALTPVAVAGDAAGFAGAALLFAGFVVVTVPLALVFVAAGGLDGDNDHLSSRPAWLYRPGDWHPPLAWPPRRLPTPGLQNLDLPHEDEVAGRGSLSFELP